ncbi:neuraminidase-like domain-containing protein [Streptomyces bobili]|uniref:neuraminidase-like domain-containing protein n=1 Tax=Streptomyces bobili TaxID=67280 RepID=UPI0037B679BB
MSSVENQPPGGPVVEGRVFAPGRCGAAGLFVEVVDCLVGGDRRVGTAVTDEGGAFRAEPAATRPQPDLRARVRTGPEPAATVLGESAVVYGSSAPSVRLDVEVEPGSAALESEYESLVRSIGPLVGGRLAAIEESETRQDVTHLANQAGWDARAVAMAAQADRLVADSGGGVAAPLFYALLRAGLPAAPELLYRTGPGRVAAVWREAVDLGVLPRGVEAEIPAGLAAFEALAVDQLLHGRPSGVSSLEGLLERTFPGNAEGKRAFARLHLGAAGAEDFWEQVESAFSSPTRRRLQLDGQLAALTLNNAPLVDALHAAEDGHPDGPLGAPADLARRAYHRPERWLELLDDTVPDGLPGDGPQDRRARYAELLAAQVRLSFPTAVLATRVRDGELPAAAEPELREAVAGFLAEQVGRFELGVEPVEAFLARNTDVAPPADPRAVEAVKRLQRVYQLTPDDRALGVLLANGLDSATGIAGTTEREFVAARADDLGERDARLVHARARQISDAVAAVATGFLTARLAPPLGSGDTPVVETFAAAPAPPGVVAYPTLEGLFGSLNTGACEHCESVLSPAAYLVDLLHFLDPKDVPNKPLDVLLSRRPDLGNLPLTCENTDTVVPHIDLVNETLEYFVAHTLSLQGFTGHSTPADRGTEELLARPEFVDEAAYEPLRGALFPPPLPFHRPLESLRALFARLDVPLSEAMMTLRHGDALAAAGGFGSREVAFERLGLSPPEVRLLTDGSLPLPGLLGYPDGTARAQVLADLGSVRTWVTRLGLRYQEVVRVLDTRFVNPSVTLRPRLAALGVSFTDLKRLKDGALTAAQFEALLPNDLDRRPFGGDVAAWVTDPANYRRIMRLLVAVPPLAAAGGTLPAFDAFLVRRTDPDPAGAALQPLDAVRLVRFVRLWRRFGWSIEQTDSALAALFPAGVEQEAGGGPTAAGLDAGVDTALVRLGTVVAVLGRLGLNADEQLPRVLSCWADLETYGPDALYRRLFLPGGVPAAEPFADHGAGEVLSDPAATLTAQADVLRAAFQLSADDLAALLTGLGFNESTPLTLAAVSAVHRRAWLAGVLGLAPRELAALQELTGIDPFTPPEAGPGLLELLDRRDGLTAAGTTAGSVLAILRPPGDEPDGARSDGLDLALLRELRARASGPNPEADADASDERLQELLAAPYGPEAAEVFTSLISRSTAVAVRFPPNGPALGEAAVRASGCRLGYDREAGLLSFTGPLPADVRDALKALPNPPPGFADALDALFATGTERAARDSAFAEAGAAVGRALRHYPDAEPLLVAYLASAEPARVRRRALLGAALAGVREAQQRSGALAAVVIATATPLALAESLLAESGGLAAPDGTGRPALAALLAAAEGGLEPAPAAAGSTVHSGFLDVAEGDRYRFRVRSAAAIALTVDGDAFDLVDDGDAFTIPEAIALTAGRLVPLSVTATEGAPVLDWQRPGQGWQPVPPAWLSGHSAVTRLRTVLVRYLAAHALTEAFALGTEGIAGLARAELAVGGAGWLDALPAPSAPGGLRLGAVLEALLDLARLRTLLGLGAAQLAALLDASPAPGTALLTATGWDQASLDALMHRFGLAPADLAHPAALRRVAEAMALAAGLGAPVATLLSAVTPDPGPEQVRLAEAVLRARHGSQWLTVLRSVNDPLRARRRDALVAYILQELAAHPETAHVDTPDKLFEFFLMDVQQQPCTGTSRVRHAISAVQLFVDRVLMNLDPQVPAAAIGADRWSWMKRYRLWEANRQVFLWPENWLEPELRTDRSPAFRQALSELLQSDITEDTASTALLGYLTRLEEVAKLEPCAIHYDEGDADRSDEVAHVVARTAGAQRRYYYRRREPDAWTAWEQIGLDIEDNPVTPVLWKGRLLLFWLKLVSTDPPRGAMNPALAGTLLTDLSLGAVVGAGTQSVKLFPQAALCWSEYYNGQWLPPKTSDLARPTGFGKAFDIVGEGAFDRGLLVLGETLESDALRVRIWGQGNGSSFLFYNTHSLPQRQEDRPGGQEPLPLDNFAQFIRTIDTGGPTLRISYVTSAGVEADRNVVTVQDGTAYRIAAPFPNAYFPDGDQQSLIRDPWGAPFLYSDSRHAFYVTTRRPQTPFLSSRRFGVTLPEPRPVAIPRLTGQPDGALGAGPAFLIDSPLTVVHGDVEIASTGRIAPPAGRRRGPHA